jgi:hypothetical protein
MTNSNPLRSHFRQPAVYIKLPSEGRYWAPDSISLPVTGEVGIMPMTAKDEIMLRTPDALMNGQGVVSVIESCVPAIKNAWGMPTIDLDTILIAIRIATYGDDMDIESKCPKCDVESRHKLGLGQILLRVRSPDYKKVMETEGLTIRFKPLNYFQTNKNNIIAFEEQKIIALVNDEEIDNETRKAQFDIHLQNIVENNVSLLSLATESITTESGEVVTDQNHISEFYRNGNSRVIKQVQNFLRELTSVANLPPARVQCEACSEEYNVTVSFDYANFFEPLS